MADTFDGLLREKLIRPPLRKILMVAGEESGDMYAGRLCRHLLNLIDGLEIEGIGGHRMREAGAKTFYDISQMSSVGIVSMLGRLGFFTRVLGELKKKIAGGEYDAVILIDYPDFNLRIAKAADEAGTPVFYYVCPQFWAWRRYRLRAVRQYIDMMIVVFPFEEEFYKGRSVNAQFFGHPILDELPVIENKAELKTRFGAAPGHTLLGVLPGSRYGEVSKMLPLMLKSIKIIRASKPVKVVIPCAESVDSALLEKIVKNSGEEAVVVKGKTWEIMNACDFLICKSGTSTLQAAIAETPMVIVYKSDVFSYTLAKALTHVKYAGLPNLLAGREITPELLQWKATPKNIAEATLAYLTDPEKKENMRADLAKIRESLGNPGASRRAAGAIADFMKRVKNI